MAHQEDIARIRSLFPALGSPAAAAPTVFLDNAGGSQVPAAVPERMCDYMRATYVQLGADYDVSLASSAVVDEAHRWVTTFMNGHGRGRVALGASTSVLCAFLADAYARGSHGGRDEVIVCDAGHEANIGPWVKLADRGYRVRFWKIDPEGFTCRLDDLRDLLSQRTRLVAFHHVSNLLGEIMAVRAITDLAHAAGARVVVDGVAYAPHRAIDVAAWNVDWYAFSLYKTYGPHMAALFGTHEAFREIEGPNHFFVDPADAVYKFELGGICHEGCAGILGIRDYLQALAKPEEMRETQDPRDHRQTGCIEQKGRGALGSSDAREPGDACGSSDTLEPGDACGSSAALEPNDAAAAAERGAVVAAFARMRALEEPLQAQLLAYLAGRSDLRVIGPPAADETRVPTISFVHERKASREIVLAANRQGLGIRYGHFYAHRLCSALGLYPEDGVVRVSLVHYNTREELDRLIAFFESI